MQKNLIKIFQAFIILVGIVVLAFMLWEPTIEGRNVNATLFEVYFKDPFLACAYVASIPFFVALYQKFKLLGYVGQGKLFSSEVLKSLRIIKYCAMIIVGCAVAAEAYLFIVRPDDDIAGGVFMGAIIFSVSLLATVTAGMFERIVGRG